MRTRSSIGKVGGAIRDDMSEADACLVCGEPCIDQAGHAFSLSLTRPRSFPNNFAMLAVVGVPRPVMLIDRDPTETFSLG